jgi:hypothetical protein
MNFFKRLPILIMAGLFLCALRAPAGGSRVGNGDGSKSSKKIFLDKSFEIETPMPFTQIREYADGIKIEGPLQLKMRKGPVGPIPMLESQSIKLMRLKEQLPGMTSLSKQQLLDYLKDRKWDSIDRHNDCTVAQKITNENYTTIIVTWGDDNGYMIAADKTEEATNAALAIVKSTKLNTGCRWK